MYNIKIFLPVISFLMITHESYAQGKEGSPSPAPYVLASCLLIPINVGIDVINITHIRQGTNRKTSPITGLITGSLQIALGVGNYSKFNEMKEFSIFNIGLGATTIALSACNLISNKKAKEKNTSFNFNGYPNKGKGVAFAFSYIKRF